jgi:beta-glucosidase
VTFELPFEAFRIVDADANYVVEPGEFEISVGPSSRDQDLQLKALLTIE